MPSLLRAWVQFLVREIDSASLEVGPKKKKRYDPNFFSQISTCTLLISENKITPFSREAPCFPIVLPLLRQLVPSEISLLPILYISILFFLLELHIRRMIKYVLLCLASIIKHMHIFRFSLVCSFVSFSCILL